MRGGVVPQIGVRLTRVRRAATATTLIEQDDAVLLRIEEPPVPRCCAATRSAVQEDHGLALGIAADLPGHPVSVAREQVAAVMRLDRRIQRIHVHGSQPPGRRRTPEPLPPYCARASSVTSGRLAARIGPVASALALRAPILPRT